MQRLLHFSQLLLLVATLCFGVVAHAQVTNKQLGNNPTAPASVQATKGNVGSANNNINTPVSLNKSGVNTLKEQSTPTSFIISPQLQTKGTTPNLNPQNPTNISDIDLLEDAHYRIFKNIKGQQYQDAVLAYIREIQANYAPNFPVRMAGNKAKPAFESWILSYPNEFNNYLRELDKLNFSFRSISNIGNFANQITQYNINYQSLNCANTYDAVYYGDACNTYLGDLVEEKETNQLQGGLRSCFIQASICTPGTAGPFNFNSATPNVDFAQGCLNQQQGLNQYGFILLNITTTGNLNMLINGNNNTGYIDVLLYNIPQGEDPCDAVLNSANQIGCGYAQNSGGCIQFGNQFGCNSSFPAPFVTAGQQVMIIVQNWGYDYPVGGNPTGPGSTSFTLQLGTGAGTGPYNGTVNPVAPVCANAGAFQMTSVTGGGAWSASCGACIDPNTGMFNPTAAGVGSHTVNYSVGPAPCTGTGSTTVQVIQCCPPVSFVNLPASTSCTSGNITLYANEAGFTPGQAITPCYYVEIQTNANHTTLQVNYLENGVLIGSLNPTPNTNWSGYGSFMSPTANNQVQLCETAASIPGGNITYNIRDCHSGALLATGTWVMDGACQTVNVTPPASLTGSATWSSSSPTGLVTVTDWGAAVFSPSAAGPGSHTVTYCWNAQNGCQACQTQTITVTNPFTSGFSYPQNSYCQGGGNVNPSISGTSGGTFSSTPAGLSINAATGQINLNTSSANTYTITYSVGTAPCSSSSTFTLTVNPIPTVNAVSNQTHCAGAASTAVNFSGAVGGTTYNWTNSNTGIGLGASGSGNIPSFTTTNGTGSPITSTITVTPTANGCTGTPINFTITVNPTPTVNAVSNQTHCNGATTTAINFTGNVAGATYNWTNNNTSIGLGASGSGNIGSFTAVNTGNTPVTSTITVTPTANGCTGTPISFTITVNPTPTVNSVANQTICAGQQTTAVNFSGNVAGTTYNWTNNNTSIGLGASGSGNIAAFTGTNTGTLPITGTITVTPTINGCPGTPTSFTITINPVPTVNPIGNQTVCNGSSTAAVNITGSMGGSATYNWTNNNPSIGLPASGSGNIGAFTAVNTGSSPVVATITITPTANGCSGTPTSFTITVNPTPTVNSVSNQTICAGQQTTAINFSGAVVGTTYNWTNSNVSIGLGSNGSGNITAFTGTNTGTSPITGTITVTPTVNGCSGTPTNFTITVNPVPTVSSVPNQTLCNGASTTAINFTGNMSGSATYNWTNSNTSIGLGASGTGNIGSFTAVNTGNAPVTSTITVTPTANGCPGTPITFTITVNPTPVVNAVPNQTLCNGAATTAVNFTGNVAGTTYNWTNSNTSIGLGASGTGNIGSFIAVNNGTIPITSTITATPTANGCSGSPITFTITVNPTDGASFAYNPNTHCLTGTNPTPTVTTPGGTFSGAGVVFVSTSTGEVNLLATGVGSYTITYTTNGLCPTSSSVTFQITTAPDATFSYGGPYCQNGTNPLPTFPAGSSSGVFSFTPAGLSINTSTGLINAGTSTPGTYDVTNFIAAAGGCAQASHTTQVVIIATDDASFTYGGSTFCQTGTDATATITGLAGGTFTSTPAGLVINSTTGEITVSTSSLNTYTVTYTTNGACPNSSTATVTITAAPDATFSLGGPFCNDAVNETPVFLPGASAGVFTANPVGLDINSATGEINIQNSTPGVYTVFNDIAAQSGCAPAQHSVTFEIIPMDDSDFAYSNAVYCTSDPVQTSTINGLSGGTFSEVSGTPGIIIDPATGAFDPSVTTPNTYTISYTTNGLCPTTTTVNVTISNQLDATITQVGPFCSTDPVTNLTAVSPGGIWSGTGITDASLGTFDPSVAGTGSWVIQYSISGSCGDTQIITIDVNQTANATINPVGPFCEIDAAVNISSVQSGGTWSGTGITDAVNGTFDPATAGVGSHTIYYTIPNPCGDIDSIIVVVSGSLAPTITAQSDLCSYDGSVQLIVDVSGGVWSGSGVDANGVFSPSVSGAGQHQITYTTSGACGGSDAITINVGGPNASFTANPPTGTIPLSVDFTNTSTGSNLTSDWFFGNGLTSNQTNPSTLYENLGDYNVVLIVTDDIGCSDTAEFAIVVVGESGVLIPNVFTPNGDGINDIFYVTTENIVELKATVFNRWGQVVFEWDALNSGWDGRTLAGEEASEGTYFFVFKALGADGKEYDYTGSVLLRR
ncbi:MAG: gliding motility-associated C-terminal domain-containing protein [Flavobacteriales bacterium]